MRTMFTTQGAIEIRAIRFGQDFADSFAGCGRPTTAAEITALIREDMGAEDPEVINLAIASAIERAEVMGYIY